jgi:glycerol-3-phosphate dehydrogenase
MTTTLRQRAARLDRLEQERFDVLVIGGGINGAGIARDAAMRGLMVALVEREDFASGTSSRSSRLIHGGIRYLEHGFLHLVFESSRERRTLLRIAPHLVRPLEFTWPVYEGARVPRWKLGAGLVLYDALSLFRNVAMHRQLGHRKIMAREPALREEGLVGGAAYYDASTDDTRLTLANSIAAAEAGAVVLNHVTLTGLTRGDGGIARAATVVDRLGGRELTIAADAIVNATGPWSDEIRRLEEGTAEERPAVRGTKGVHIAVPRERVNNRGAVTLLSPLDGRVMFVLPAGRFAIIGTTDTETSASPDDVRATTADVDYLLSSASEYFPESQLTMADVVSAWAGIRPLIATGFTRDASSASREHLIGRGPSGVITVSGGKLTTYRSMAAEVVDMVQRALGREPTPSKTHAVPLPGGDIASYDAELARAREKVGAHDVAERLVRAFGGRWREVWRLVDGNRALAEPVVEGLPYVMAELVYGVQHERACSLGDLLIRRTHIAFETVDAGLSAAPVAAALVAPLLGWDDAAVADALAAYEQEAGRIFAVEDEPSTA